MDRTETEKIRQVIEDPSKQMNHLDPSVPVDMLTKSVLTKEEVCNLLIQIAEHKSLIEQLDIDVGDALEVDVKRITDSLDADKGTSP